MKLSICIPTWNRERPLRALLDSLLAQPEGDFEVVVSDNASTDGTKRMVRAWHKANRHVPLVYRRNAENVGLDRNVACAIRTAHGEYVWVVGSDDELEPGAISRALDTFTAAPGAVVLAERKTMTNGRILEHQQFTNWSDWSTFWLDRPHAVTEYLVGAQSVCAALTFFSSLIVPRVQWLKHMSGVGTFYGHTVTVWNAVLAGVPLVIRRKPFIRAHVGNPQRRDHETLEHVDLDVRTFRLLARLQHSADDAKMVRQMLRFEYPAERLASIHDRCCREPAYAFTMDALDIVLEGR